MKIRKNILNRRSASQSAVYIVASILIGLLVLSYVASFFWGIMAACKTHKELLMEPFAWPKKWNFNNFILAFKSLKVYGVGLAGLIENSLILAFFGPFLAIGGSTILAYVVAKYNFVGKKLLLAVNVIVISLPLVGTQGSTYRVFSSLKMIDSPLLLLNFIGNFGSNFLYMLSCFKNISNTYMEAARIDGAGHYKIMFKVMIPLAIPLASALWIMSIISTWNDVNMALLYWPRRPTLATGIYLFREIASRTNQLNVYYAAVMLSSIPPLVLFSIFHKKILANVTFGGLKG